MQNLIRGLAIAAAALALWLAARAIFPSAPGTSSPEPEAPALANREPGAAPTPTPLEPTGEASESAARAREPARAGPLLEAEESGAAGDLGDTPSNAELTAWLNRNPLSRQPHEVVRAWGGPPGTRQMVGLHVVVDSSLATPALEQLVRDLREAYGAAPIFATHVYDSEEAAVYDRHRDGGALAARHLVARVVRDPSLERDSIQVRGEFVDPEGTGP